MTFRNREDYMAARYIFQVSIVLHLPSSMYLHAPQALIVQHLIFIHLPDSSRTADRQRMISWWSHSPGTLQRDSCFCV